MARVFRRLLLPLLCPSNRQAFVSAVLALCLAATATLRPWPAIAATTTATFTVQITITNACVIISASSINFGTVGVINGAGIDQTGTITVQCTLLAPFNIGLNAGTGTGATVANRLMTNGANTVAYSLFRDAAHLLVWGNTISTDTVASVGTGAAQAFTVFGHVPTQSTPAAGTYNDTITVTVTF